MTAKQQRASAPSPVSPDASEGDEAVAAFQTFMQRIQTQRTPAILEIGISMAQVKVLHAVAAAGQVHGSELAHWVGTTPSTVSGLVDRLVDHDLLARRDDPLDRRQVLISVTPAGLELIDRFRELNRRMLDSLLGRVSPADLRTVTRAFRILDQAAIDMASDLDPQTSPPMPPRKDAP